MEDIVPQDIPQKQCTACLKEFPATTKYFYTHKSKDTLRSQCKKCCNQTSKQNYQDHKEEINNRHREYQRTHLAEANERAKKHARLHREEKKAYDRYYQQTHREVTRAAWRNRHARKLNNGGFHTVADIAKQYKNQRGKCYYCKTKISQDKRGYDVDHVIPLARGGSNGPENLVVTCPTCNRSKNARMPHEWPQGGRLL